MKGQDQDVVALPGGRLCERGRGYGREFSVYLGRLPLLAKDIYVRCLCCPVSRPTATFRGLFLRVKTTQETP